MSFYFDYIRVSADIGELKDVQCETQSLSNTGSRFWVSPAGELFVVDYEGTHDFVILTETDPEYDHQYSWRNYDIVKNGAHGVVSPVDFTGVIDFRAAMPDPDEDMIYGALYFERGICPAFRL